MAGVCCSSNSLDLRLIVYNFMLLSPFEELLESCNPFSSSIKLGGRDKGGVLAVYS